MCGKVCRMRMHKEECNFGESVNWINRLIWYRTGPLAVFWESSNCKIGGKPLDLAVNTTFPCR